MGTASVCGFDRGGSIGVNVSAAVVAKYDKANLWEGNRPRTKVRGRCSFYFTEIIQGNRAVQYVPPPGHSCCQSITNQKQEREDIAFATPQRPRTLARRSLVVWIKGKNPIIR